MIHECPLLGLNPSLNAIINFLAVVSAELLATPIFVHPHSHCLAATATRQAVYMIAPLVERAERALTHSSTSHGRPASAPQWGVCRMLTTCPCQIRSHWASTSPWARAWRRECQRGPPTGSCWC